MGNGKGNMRAGVLGTEPPALSGPLWRNIVHLFHRMQERLLKVLVRAKSASRMQLVERVTVAPRHQLVLVEIDGERCLLTFAPNSGIGFHLLGVRQQGVAQAQDEPHARMNEAGGRDW